MASRKEYYTRIFTYKKRLERYRHSYKGDIPLYKTKQYLNLRKRISQWTKEIKRIDTRHDRINKLLKAVNKYFSVDVSVRVNQCNRARDKINLARQIFFKIGLESGIRGVYLAKHIGRLSGDVAAWNRKKLISSFGKKPENRQAYYSFKKHFEGADES